MSNLDFEEDVSLFWDECDAWCDARLNEIVAQGSELSEDDINEIQGKVENDINALIEKGVMSHGQAFTPDILKDLYHLFFELELKKLGVANEDQIHRYKDNAQVGLSAVEGKITPDNAVLLMEINRTHLEKKGGKDEGVCDDCICGKK